MAKNLDLRSQNTNSGPKDRRILGYTTRGNGNSLIVGITFGRGYGANT